MVYFIVRVLVNTIVLGITVSLLPGIQVYPLVNSTAGTILSFLGTGLVLAVVNALVCPVVLFITGNLYVSQMAIVVLLTTSVILLIVIVELISPAWWYVESLWWILPGAAIMAVVTLILEALFGLHSPVIGEEQHQNPFYWRW